MDDFRVPVYVIMGLLESGKSSFINEILGSGEFEDGTPGVVLTCEEGEVEISPSSAARCGMAIENVDEEEQLTGEFFQNLEKKYHPEKVFVEYNGMWDPDSIMNADFPDGWQIYQVVTLIDASTFAIYIQNMRSIIGNIIKCTELAIFNRCSEDQDLPMFRRNIKATNPQIQIMFEHKDGRMIELGKDIPPYDLNAPVIEISDEDFGIWYMDAAEDRERYDGKVVHFKGKVMKNRKFPHGYFVPGRNAMTCCAADIRFIGFLCKTSHIDELTHGQWLDITAKIKYERRKEYGGVGPVLHIQKAKSAQPPKEDLVYFY